MKRLGLYLLCILIFISILFVFCLPSAIRKELVLAEGLMDSTPDSSLYILQNIPHKELLGEDKALYALLMTQAAFKNHEPTNSDSLINIAVDYYKERKDSLRKAQSYFYKGRIDEKMGDVKGALICYQMASASAINIDNYKLLMLIYNYWGLLLRKEGLYDDALIALKKSLKYAELDNNILDQVFVQRNIGATYFLVNDFKKAHIYFKKALFLAYQLDNKKCISDIYGSLSNLYLDEKNYDSAMLYINKSILLETDSAAIYSTFLQKGKLFLIKEKYDSARYYFDKGNMNIDLSSKAIYCIFMSKVEGREHNYEKALMHLNQYVNYSDSISKKRRTVDIAALQKKYDYSLIENENNQLKIARQRMYLFMLAIGLLSVITSTLLVYYYKRKRAVKKAMKEEIEKMKSELIDQSLIHAQEKSIQIQKHQNELLMKEQELGVHLSKKTEELNLRVQKEQELKEYIFKMDDIVQKINSLNSLKALQRSKSASKYVLSFEELNSLEEAVNLCYDNFVDRLRIDFPKLKNDDIHLCCLLKMKVPNKNILSLLDTNELTLKKRRYRIKHDKMGFSDNIESLDEFLSDY